MAVASERHPIGDYLSLGIIQGLMLLSVSEAWPSLGGGGRTALAGLLAFGLVGTLQAQLLGERFYEGRRWRLVLGCALLLGALAAWFVWQVHPQRGSRMDGSSIGVLLCINLMLFYILTPFVQAWESRTGWRFDYSQLYRDAWSNGLILLLSVLLVGLFWLLIALWAGLFSMVGIRFFSRLFSSGAFVWISCALVFSVGVRIGLQRDQVIESLRSILLAICRALLPLVVLIVLLFVISLPFTGLEPLWQTKRASAILLTLLFVHLSLVNGVFQDGRQSASYPHLLQRLVDASLLVLPLLAALAGYSLWLRVQQYGLTPSRVLVGLLVFVALLYAVAAAAAVLRRGPVWLEALRISNPPSALAAATLLVLLQTPVLSPQELSAASQYRRLVSGQMTHEQFDVGLLRFKLGEPGRRYLARLEQLVKQPGALPLEQAVRLRADLEQLRRSKDYWEWQRSRRERQAVAEVQPQWLGAAPDDIDGLLGRLATSNHCRWEPCSLLAVDLDGDAVEEVLVIGDKHSYAVTIFARDPAGAWQPIGRLNQPPGKPLSGTELAERIRREGFRLVPSRYQALEVGGIRFEPRLP